MILDLSRNPIETLPADLLDRSPKIKYLDVRHMNIRTLGEGFIPARRVLNVIMIAHNPWLCDCGISYVVGLSRFVLTIDVAR